MGTSKSKMAAINALYGTLQITDQHIRILTLHPSFESNAPIQCSLHIEPLPPTGQTGLYTALSYCWAGEGDNAKKKHRITINRQEIFVLDNLFQALVHLRYRKTARSLWIDALCINQTDSADKNQQVSNMGNIYSVAASVVIWLGADCEKETLGTPILDAEYSKEIPRPRYTFSENTEDANASNELLKGLVNPVARLTLNVYWSRVWIIQEIIHAQKLIICFGHRQMQSTEFLELFRQTHKTRLNASNDERRKWLAENEMPMRLLQQHAMMADWKAGKTAAQPLELLTEWLTEFRGSNCSNLHDIVYGFRSLLSPISRELIVVDYKKDLNALFEETRLAEMIAHSWEPGRNADFELASRLRMDFHKTFEASLYNAGDEKRRARLRMLYEKRFADRGANLPESSLARPFRVTKSETFMTVVTDPLPW